MYCGFGSVLKWLVLIKFPERKLFCEIQEAIRKSGPHIYLQPVNSDQPPVEAVWMSLRACEENFIVQFVGYLCNVFVSIIIYTHTG